MPRATEFPSISRSLSAMLLFKPIVKLAQELLCCARRAPRAARPVGGLKIMQLAGFGHKTGLKSMISCMSRGV